MNDTKKTITVTVRSSHERKLWTDNGFIEFGQYKERRPMTQTTTIEVGPVLVEIDVATIVREIASTAMMNSTKKASALRGNIRAKVLEVDTTKNVEPSHWAGPIEVWTKEIASRWNQGEEITRFEPVGYEYGPSRSDLEEEGWTYQETINDTEGGTT